MKHSGIFEEMHLSVLQATPQVLTIRLGTGLNDLPQSDKMWSTLFFRSPINTESMRVALYETAREAL